MDFGPADALVPIMEQELAGMSPVFPCWVIHYSSRCSFPEHSAKSESGKETAWAGTWSWAEEIGGVDEGG